MLTREITLPVDVERMWEALADPSDWIGADVEWELVPGGRARFLGDPAGDREGRVDDVEPGRRLAFHWWPEADPADESEVACELEPVEDGTRLVVTERRLHRRPGDLPAALTSDPQASAQPATRAAADGMQLEPAWSGWDSRLAGLWVTGSAPVLARA